MKIDVTAYKLRHSLIIGPTSIWKCQTEDVYGTRCPLSPAISIRPEFNTLEGTYECNLGYVKIDATAYNLRH